MDPWTHGPLVPAYEWMSKHVVAVPKLANSYCWALQSPEI